MNHLILSYGLSSLIVLSASAFGSVGHVISDEKTGAPLRIPNHTDKQALTANTPTHHDASNNSYVYDAWITTHQDLDYDGYASSFTLSADIDTYSAARWVYVRLTISDDLYHYRSYHRSSDILIEGDSSLDVLNVETQLKSDFPPADYSFAIELYDAENHQLLDVYDTNDDSDLLYIPLESREYDRHTMSVVSVEAQGGTLGLASIFAVGGLVLFRRRAR